MSTTYSVTVRCDDRRAPDCQRAHTQVSSTLQPLSSVVFLAQAGWQRGYGVEDTVDVCPACLAWLREQAEGVQRAAAALVAKGWPHNYDPPVQDAPPA